MTKVETNYNASIDALWNPENDGDDGIDMDVSAIAAKVRSGEIPPQQLKLLPYQVDHFHRIADDIIPRRAGYLDGSMTGRGKTMVTAAISISYDLPVFVVCPNTVKKVWDDTVTAYAVDCITIITYDLLAGKKPVNISEEESVRETPLSHGYLIRIDKMLDKEKLSYAPTRKLLNLIGSENSPNKGGALFVFDECQNIKNHNTARFKACRTIANTLISVKHCSRFAALSASPFDKVEHALAFFRLFGVLNNTQLYTKRKATLQVYFLGLEEIIDYANTLDPIQCKVLQYNYSNELCYDNIDQFRAREFAYSIYEKIVKNHIGSSIPDPKDFESTKNITTGKLFIYDGYFNVPIEDRTNLRNNINALMGVVKPIIQGLEVATMNHLAQMTLSRKAIEMDKAYLFASLAARKLNESPSNRVILIMNFIDSINVTAEALKEYIPMILTGKTKNRSEIIDRFQKPDNRDRLLIMNTKVGGQGISLHDLYGGRGTHVFISPDFSIINIFQAVGRVYRTGLKSDAYVYLVYGVHKGCYETNIINALASKNKVVKGSIPGLDSEGDVSPSAKNKVLFPGEYPKFIEENDEGGEEPSSELILENSDSGQNNGPLLNTIGIPGFGNDTDWLSLLGEN